MAEDEKSYLKEIRSPSTLKRVLDFEIPRERVEREIKHIMEEIRRDITIPGFRKGKAPRDLVAARYGKTAEKEAIKRIIPEAYEEALKKNSLEPILPGEIRDVRFEGESLTFSIEVELFPEVKIEKYTGIEVKKEVKEVTEEDIEREIESLKERLSYYEPVEREARQGDVVVIDYWRLNAEGQPIKLSKVTDFPVEVGAGKLFESFEKALIGVRKGERKTVEITYPDDFPDENVRGRTVRFGFDVKEVREKRTTELNEETLKKIGYTSLDELKRAVREHLERAYEEDAVERMKSELMRKLIEDNPFEVPEGAVDLCVDWLSKSYYGGIPDNVDEAKRKEIEKTREKLRPLATNIVKEEFIAVEIAKREGITVSEEDIEKTVQAYADRNRVSPDDVRRWAVRSGEIRRWRRQILREKVMNFLLENAEVKT